MIMTKVRADSINLADVIHDYVAREDFDQVLFIVPTNRRARQLKREFLEGIPKKAAHSIHIETLQTIATKLLQSGDIHLNLINDPTSHVLLRQCFKETHLPFLKNKKSELPTGTRQRLRFLFSELMRHGITSAALKSEITGEASDYSNKKTTDIAALFESYENKLQHTGYTETGSLFGLLFSERVDIDAQFGKLYPNVNLIILSGYSEFSTPEVELINALADLEGKDLYLNFDYTGQNYQLFGSLDSCYKDRLTKKGFTGIADGSSVVNNEFLSYVRASLFLENITTPRSSFANQLFLIKGNDVRNEVQNIAKEIKFILTQNPAIKPSSICVAFNLIEPYSPVVRSVFSSYGIPFNLTDRPYLSTSPAVISIMNFLELRAEDYFYKTLFAAFDTDIIPLYDCTLHDLIGTAAQVRIISGYEHWIQAEELLRNSREDGEEPQEREIKRARRCVKSIKAIDRLLQPLLGELTPRKFYEELEKLIVGFKMHEKLLKYPVEDAEYAVKAITGFLAMVKELCDLSEMEFGINTRFAFSHYLKQIKNSLLVTRYNINEKPGYGVLITTPDEIRGLSFDYLFIGGLFDGNFPTRYTPDVFAPPSHAKSDRQHLLENQYLFYQMLTVFHKRLYFSYPVSDGKKDLMQSSFLTALQKICAITEVDTSRYSNALFSKTEYLTALGKHWDEYFAADAEGAGSDFASLFAIDAKRIEGSLEEFNGVLDSSALSELAKDRLAGIRGKQFSISQLETYAKCPFKYFSERVMQLTIEDEPQEEADRMEIGSLLHAILFKFYVGVNSQSIVVQNCDEKTFTTAKNLLFDIAKNELANTQAGKLLPFWDREKIIGINGDEKQSILFKFLVNEREEIHTHPLMFETAFGTFSTAKDGEATYAAIEIGGVKLRGKIDRIDVDEDNHLFRIYDYKTRKSASISKDIDDALALQLPVYVIAGESILKEHSGKEYSPDTPVIYSLKYSDEEFGTHDIIASSLKKRGKLSEEEKTLIARENIAFMRKIAEEKIPEYVNNITDGKFYLSLLPNREDKICAYCDFIKICRIGESVPLETGTDNTGEPD
jgi:ATP-dependent helicase/nuclease subunit B